MSRRSMIRGVPFLTSTPISQQGLDPRLQGHSACVDTKAVLSHSGTESHRETARHQEPSHAREAQGAWRTPSALPVLDQHLPNSDRHAGRPRYRNRCWSFVLLSLGTSSPPGHSRTTASPWCSVVSGATFNIGRGRRRDNLSFGSFSLEMMGATLSILRTVAFPSPDNAMFADGGTDLAPKFLICG